MDPGKHFLYRKLHPDASGGADQHLVGMHSQSHGHGIGRLFGGAETGNSCAGIGVAAVEDDSPGLAILKMTSGEQDGGGLDEIGREDTRGRSGNLGNDQAEVTAERSFCGGSSLDSAGGGTGKKTSGGIHSAGNSLEIFWKFGGGSAHGDEGDKEDG